MLKRKTFELRSSDESVKDITLCNNNCDLCFICQDDQEPDNVIKPYSNPKFSVDPKNTAQPNR